MATADGRLARFGHRSHALLPRPFELPLERLTTLSAITSGSGRARGQLPRTLSADRRGRAAPRSDASPPQSSWAGRSGQRRLYRRGHGLERGEQIGGRLRTKVYPPDVLAAPPR